MHDSAFATLEIQEEIMEAIENPLDLGTGLDDTQATRRDYKKMSFQRSATMDDPQKLSATATKIWERDAETFKNPSQHLWQHLTQTVLMENRTCGIFYSPMLKSSGGSSRKMEHTQNHGILLQC